jgi:hypothetical protein
MRKEYYNYVVKLPVLLHELFRGKVADYHFSDMTYSTVNIMSKKMVIVVTAVGVRKVVEKWLCENMTCELVVSRNARHECCVEVIYDSGNPSVLRTLLRSAVGEIIELC